jgi:hypothetical protein
MRITDQYFWNIVFSLFFLVLVVMGTIILDSEARIQLVDLSVTDYVLITLASWRVTRLFVYDAITKFFREQFWDVTKVGKGYVLEKPKTGPRRTLADLTSCAWCFGIWATASVTFLYLLSEWFMFLTIFLALSAVATFLQLVSNLVGNKSDQIRGNSSGTCGG